MPDQAVLTATEVLAFEDSSNRIDGGKSEEEEEEEEGREVSSQLQLGVR
jgi:hypothetical protein